MTVCTASLFQWNYGSSDEPKWGPAFIAAADRMLTDQGLGIEYETSRWKATIMRSTHMILVAGDFTFLSEAITQTSRFLPNDEVVETSAIAEALSKAFVLVRNTRLERRYLAPHGLTLEKLASTDINRDLADRLHSEIERPQFDVEALVVGCSEEAAGLFRVDEFGVVTNHIDIGFLSIGGGGIHASAQFMHEPYNHHRAHAPALLSTFRAKKRAEIAPGVGATTDMFRITREAVFRVPDEIVDHMERGYRAQRKSAERQYKAAFESIETMFNQTNKGDTEN